jgi:hypothetical protein
MYKYIQVEQKRVVRLSLPCVGTCVRTSGPAPARRTDKTDSGSGSACRCAGSWALDSAGSG